MERADYQKIFSARQADFIEDWKRVLRIPSISNNPAYSAECLNCAEAVRTQLERIGLRAEVHHTSGKPIVFAEREGDASLPVLLYYGHYDVQPADPLDEWTNPPFEPTLRDGRMYARGALDNKGQSAAFFAALETALREGTLKCTIKVVIEGEEESGSDALFQSLSDPQWRQRLKADVLLVSDSEAHAPGVPAITMGLRGIIHLTVKLYGPRFDLHSGLHGGTAPNPALGMARLLATLHEPSGRIAVAGYYDSVKPLDADTRALLMSTAFDAQKYERDFGVAPLGGERDLAAQERLAFRPTIEINGIHSGYAGPGHKTIIPAKAEARITCRLAAGQDPGRSLQLIQSHLQAHVPPGYRLEFDEVDGTHGALTVDPQSEVIGRAARVLEQANQHKPVYLWCPASIPVVVSLVKAINAQPLLVGFGLPEDRMHGPDESFSLSQFRDAFLYDCMILEELSRRVV